MPPELAGPYIPTTVAFVVSSFITLSSTRDLIDGLRSYGWPHTLGRIVDKGYSLGASRHAVDDSIVFAYVYMVDGIRYRSVRFDFAGRNTLRRSRELSSLAPGRRVDVFYDPKRPDRAVLERGVGEWTFIPPMLGALAMLVTGPIANRTLEILLAR